MIIIAMKILKGIIKNVVPFIKGGISNLPIGNVIQEIRTNKEDPTTGAGKLSKNRMAGYIVSGVITILIMFDVIDLNTFVTVVDKLVLLIDKIMLL